MKEKTQVASVVLRQCVLYAPLIMYNRALKPAHVSVRINTFGGLFECPESLPLVWDSIIYLVSKRQLDIIVVKFLVK